MEDDRQATGTHQWCRLDGLDRMEGLDATDKRQSAEESGVQKYVYEVLKSSQQQQTEDLISILLHHRFKVFGPFLLTLYNSLGRCPLTFFLSHCRTMSYEYCTFKGVKFVKRI